MNSVVFGESMHPINVKFSCDTCMEELPNYDFSSNQSQFQTGKANISQDCW